MVSIVLQKIFLFCRRDSRNSHHHLLPVVRDKSALKMAQQENQGRDQTHLIVSSFEHTGFMILLCGKFLTKANETSLHRISIVSPYGTLKEFNPERFNLGAARSTRWLDSGTTH